MRLPDPEGGARCRGASPWRPAATLLLLLLYLDPRAASSSDPGGVFHNQFAVHIDHHDPHGRADRLAREHGFVNLGPIGSLEGHFLFEHARLHKRSTEASAEHHGLLSAEPDVRWVEQQRELRRPKRDLQWVEPEESFPMPDPLWRYQWFLDHGAHDGSDMHVQPAWRMGYTGKGVVVTILDDGIQTNHPDLVRNYDPQASSDINSNDDDPMPRDDGDNKHGTRCAGEVAAEAFNDVCGVGVAFNASIGGVRMLDGMVNDAVEAKALSLNPQHIDIYSASWGPEDDGKTVDGPGALAKKAFVDGVKYGRGGKGSIFVWASGNGGRKTDNCNCDGYTNSIFTLSISSASQGGRKPWYLEECSSTLATTYSSGTPSQDDSITTVDQDAKLRPDKICTSLHTGTSASAPIAAGVCALALEANPRLTWRDMQHLVVATSNPNPLLLESGWEVNGRGRKFSHKFGYGLMDAAAMVSMAKVWPGVGKQAICETKPHRPLAPIPDNSKEVARVTVATNGCLGTGREVRYLEHVQCKITLQYNPRGALHIVLTSPSGTRSSLLLPRPKDKSSAGFNEWPFLSVHFWGERPQGNWTLEVYRSPRGVPEGLNLGPGILKEWKLMFYGTKESILDMGDNEVDVDGRNPKQEVVEEELEEEEDAAPTDSGSQVISSHVNRTLIAEHSAVGQHGCNLQCASETGCSGSGPHQCHACKLFSFGRICVGACPARTFATLERECYPCSHQCHGCFGPEANQCLTCSADRLLLSDKSLCVEKCPWGYRLDSSEKKQCLPCPENCESCTEVEGEGDGDSGRLLCTSCAKDLVISPDAGSCLDNCPAGFFINSQTRRCDPCDGNCTTCIGPLPTQCALCRQGAFYFQRRCVAKCPARHTEDLHNSECVPCPTGCSDCALLENGVTACRACLPHWRKNFTSGDCEPEANLNCPGEEKGDEEEEEKRKKGVAGQFGDAQGACRDCHPSCGSCAGGSADDCLSCPPRHLLHISSCMDSCPAMTYAIGGHCRHCPHACAACDDARVCTECQQGYVLDGSGRCAANCAPGEHAVAGACRPCHRDCLSCNGFSEHSCLTCPVGTNLYLGQCVKTCPLGFYHEGAVCQQCHPSCKSCTGPGADECLHCHPGTKLVSGGVCASCAPAFFFGAGSCHKCHPSCSSCSGPDESECTACARPLAHDPWSHACVSCCRGPEDKECCECAAGGARCAQQARGAAYSKKRSFREEISSSSRSAFFFFCVLAAVSVLTFMLWRAYWKRARISLRRLHRAATSNGNGNGHAKNGFLKKALGGRKQRARSNGDYSQIPLMPVEEEEAAANGSNGLPHLRDDDDEDDEDDRDSFVGDHELARRLTQA